MADGDQSEGIIIHDMDPPDVNGWSNDPLPDRRKFREKVDLEELDLLREARSRRAVGSARRRAIENVLLRDGLMEIVGHVSRDLSSGRVTE